jgi:hypothetical protein
MSYYNSFGYLASHNDETVFLEKGQITSSNGNDEVTLSVGTDGQFLSASNAAESGLEWISVTSLSTVGGANNLFAGGSYATVGTSSNNVAFGIGALDALVTGSTSNVAIGYLSGATVSTGTFNTLLGAGSDATSGSSYSVCIGADSISTENNECVIGGSASLATTIQSIIPGRSGETSLGTTARKFSNASFSGTVDAANFTVASAATNLIQTSLGDSGNYSASSATALTTGSTNNTFYGNGSGIVTSTGDANTFIGYQTGTTNTIGSNNTLIGEMAGLNTVEANNTAVGSGALLTGSTSASGNTCIGRNAGATINSGSNNTCIGFSADTADDTTYSIALGFNASTTADQQLMIGGAVNNITSIVTGVASNGTTGCNIGETGLKFKNGFFAGSIEAASYTTSGVAGGMFRTDKTSSYWFTDSAFAAELGSANNVVVGVGAFPAVTSASLNVVVGNSAMSVAEAATGCVALGYIALGQNVNGHGNTAVGHSAGNGAVSSSDAVYIGNLAGASNGNSTGGVCIGSSSQIAGYDYSVALGYGATATANNQLVLGGTTNNIISFVTGVASNGTTGCNIGETGLKFKNGYFAGAIEAASYTVGGVVTYPPRAIATNGIFINGSVQDTTGSNNTVFGILSGDAITEGTNNVLVGTSAGVNVIDGGGNVCVGSVAGTSISGGYDNVCVGRSAGNSIIGGSHNVCLGYNTDTGAEFIHSIAIGSGAVATASQQLMVGGTSNSITEIRPAVNLATSLGSTSFRFSNVFTTDVEAASYTVGGVATYPPRSIGTDGIFINGSTQTLTNGVQNVVVGVSAGKAITSGTSNVLIGKDAGTVIDDGFSNVCVGTASGLAIVGGYNNVCIGRFAGDGITGGSSNTCVGYNSNTGAAFTNSIALGHNAIAGASRELKVGSAGATSVTAWLPGVTNEATLGSASYMFNELFCTNGTINTSDLQDKYVHEEGPPGLSFISALKPISFNWKEGETTNTHFGFGAQDVEEVMDNGTWGGISTDSRWAGVVKSRIKDVNGDERDSYGLRMTEFISPMVQAIQDVHKELQHTTHKLQETNQKMQDTKQEVLELKSMLLALVKEVKKG